VLAPATLSCVPLRAKGDNWGKGQFPPTVFGRGLRHQAERAVMLCTSPSGGSCSKRSMSLGLRLLPAQSLEMLLSERCRLIMNMLLIAFP
jgi:hypothetical protein